MWLEAVHKPKGDAQKCPTCGGEVHRRIHREMHGGSSISDGVRVDISGTPPEGYADPIVLDAITQYFDGGLYRLWPSERYLSRGGKKLHRAAWKLAFGTIPRGCHIHHRDGNPFNNSISNLECLPASIHLAEAWRNGAKAKPGYKHFGDAAREGAAKWHGSEEGRLWHRRHMARVQTWTKWKRIEKGCLLCGKRFMGVERESGYSQKYCEPRCKAAAYRKRGKASV